MEKLQLLLVEARYSQWVKNLIIFLPIFFGGSILDLNLFLDTLFAFTAFCFAASTVYIINDIKDLEEDKLHPTKKLRPLASKQVTREEAYLMIFILGTLTLLLSLFIGLSNFSVILLIYFIINISYSFYFKRVPYLELLIVSFCYLLRLEAGGVVSGIDISFWLHAVILSGAFMFVTGKRYSEKRATESRKVLKYYSVDSINKVFIISVLLNAAFMLGYSLVQGAIYLPLSFIYFATLARYYALVKNTDKGESATIFLDKYLMILISIFILYSGLIIYL